MALPLHDHSGLIRYAAMLATIGAAVEVRFVSILPAHSSPESDLDRDRLLATLESTVHEAFAGLSDVVKVYVDVLKGPLLDRLLEFAAEQEVDLILVGHDPAKGGRRSLARRLAMKAPCSVWMVPHHGPATFQKILAPIDFSPHAADALSVAAALARLRGLPQCLALHVYFDPGVARYDDYDAVIRGEERETFEKLLATIDSHGVQIEPMFVESPNVPNAILRVAPEQGVDLIVMGTRGRTRSAAILLGSETEQTLIETTIPILVVKHFGARMGVLRALLDKELHHGQEPRFG